MMSTRLPFAFLRFALLGLALSLASCAATERYTLTPEIVSDSTAPAPSLRRGRAVDDDDDAPHKPIGDFHLPGWHDSGPPTVPRMSSGLYLSLNVNYSDVLGDLDGDTAVVDDKAMPTQFVFLADIEASEGIGFDVSHRWEKYELGVGYKIVDYDASFPFTPIQKAKIKYIDLMFKRHYHIDKTWQPFLTGGIGWSKGKIKNGSFDGTSFGDAKLLDGINYNFGGGLTFAFSRWIAFYGQLLWRFGRYESVDGPFGKSLVSGNIDSDAWEISTGINIRLLPERD